MLSTAEDIIQAVVGTHLNSVFDSNVVIFHLGILLCWVQSPNRDWSSGERLRVGNLVLGPGTYLEKAVRTRAANGRETNAGISGIGSTSNPSTAMLAAAN